jgi:hypothetical protein
VRPEIDLADFFRRLIVFVLVGNCDARRKNFSLLETDAGLRAPKPSISFAWSVSSPSPTRAARKKFLSVMLSHGGGN